MAATLWMRGEGAEGRLAELFRREVEPKVAELEQRRRQHRLGFLLAGCGMLAGIFLVVLLVQNLEHALLGGVLVLVAGLALMRWAERGYTDQVRRAVMPAVCRAIGGLSHDVGAAPDLNFRRLAQIGLVPSHNRERIDDVFCGRHRDTRFTMAEVRLRRVRHSRRRRSHTAFRGLILAIEVPRPVPAQILIARDGGLIGNGLKGWLKGFDGMQRVALPDAAFEERFELYADRPEVALATVTPALCANLVALAAAQDGAPFQAAFADGRFFVALRRRGDQFRIGSVLRSTDRLEDEAARVLHEVQIVHRLIEYLHGERPPLRPPAEPTSAARGRTPAPGPVVRG
jgi:ribosomal protein L30/L7E